jgi:hypothetical protein
MKRTYNLLFILATLLSNVQEGLSAQIIIEDQRFCFKEEYRTQDRMRSIPVDYYQSGFRSLEEAEQAKRIKLNELKEQYCESTNQEITENQNLSIKCRRLNGGGSTGLDNFESESSTFHYSIDSITCLQSLICSNVSRETQRRYRISRDKSLRAFMSSSEIPAIVIPLECKLPIDSKDN